MRPGDSADTEFRLQNRGVNSPQHAIGKVVYVQSGHSAGVLLVIAMNIWDERLTITSASEHRTFTTGKRVKVADGYNTTNGFPGARLSVHWQSAPRT